MTPLVHGWQELCERMSRAGTEPMMLKVLRGGRKPGQKSESKEMPGEKTELLEMTAVGFDFGDTIIGTTDPVHAR